jgi:hypothetical protein
MPPPSATNWPQAIDDGRAGRVGHEPIKEIRWTP